MESVRKLHETTAAILFLNEFGDCKEQLKDICLNLSTHHVDDVQARVGCLVSEHFSQLGVSMFNNGIFVLIGGVSVIAAAGIYYEVSKNDSPSREIAYTCGFMLSMIGLVGVGLSFLI